jgi:glutamate synthase (NADPH/NADH) large chain
MTGGQVVVLGPTGRNFGAGMSGGVAYVLDEDDAFRGLLNPEMVDLDCLEDDDRAWLQDRVERHVAETDSAVGRRLLEDWDTSLTKFVKVMPKDYKRVLSAASQAERDGRDINEAVMAAAHG